MSDHRSDDGEESSVVGCAVESNGFELAFELGFGSRTSLLCAAADAELTNIVE